ncbi:hypothetical protein BIV57_18295 [Mangrovactinospora gilvigrisea]|uniref:Peptidase C39-like domain-containing protein n=2 Tax=Mangrovactinospora gilvigrisea TaxID=1428644 RepID=A0A1J7BBU8_9ACTN|nr:C39 family peptidase [Mangrovactinospora gilvigrisea]OIV36069.1 hypothetical protein BIV57_18295 [Mangrovactinospora gilvigrisea]
MPHASRRTVLGAAAAIAVGAALPAAAAGSARAAASYPPVQYHGWSDVPDWLSGARDGTEPVFGRRPGIAIGRPAGTTTYTDPHTSTTASWEYGTWTSPVHRLPFGATELVSSWNVDAPAGTWIQTELQGTYNDGSRTPWFVMGRWAYLDTDIKRTSVDGQDDGRSGISTDTWAIDDATSGATMTAYQLRLTLYRKPGTDATPTVWRVGAFASNVPGRFDVPASVFGLKGAVELKVPRYSQDIHSGQYPQYDNGGEAWCSPTSSSMDVAYWGRGPSRADVAWVDPSYEDPQVDYAARYTYDYQYEGCGNWPFNAAYAAHYRDMSAVITQLRSLNDVETLIAAGIPVITSQSFYASELDGSGYSTSGHLMCLVGFTADGDVVANDPASPNDDAVRHVYKRHQFETIWLRTERKLSNGKTGSGSGGVAYVYWPCYPTPRQRAALAAVGIR